MIGMGYLIKA